ncbi:hypothetical protein CU097_015032 [Rhizopus azygosporus]|uniref:Uncharacterized protein n=1 Tax=Rhizopus azygosporus TaxID=86630 RepID=A0A367K7U1_RHIAZ|nr:hypothetical protein CU097_015032 [Rhizopus azygosporus]
MPPVNVKVSVSKCFITDITMRAILLREHDWNEPKLRFQGKMIARSEELKKLTDEKILKSSGGNLSTIFFFNYLELLYHFIEQRVSPNGPINIFEKPTNFKMI